MKTQNIIAFSATLLLSSCGIYSSYQPQTSVPENLYGEEVAVSDTNPRRVQPVEKASQSLRPQAQIKF